MKLEFRLATLVIETIEKRKWSFDKAYRHVMKRKGMLNKRLLYNVYELAWDSILCSYMADHSYINVFKGRRLNIRRRCALRVAYYLVARKHMRPGVLHAYSGGLLNRPMIEFLCFIKENGPKFANGLNACQQLSIRYSYPLIIIRRLSRYMGISELERFVASQRRRRTWLRVITEKIDIDKARRELENEGVQVVQDKDYPYLLRVIHSKKIISEISLVKKLKVVPMDKGSVVVVDALSPSFNDVILDATAAPGIKASLILQLTKDKARVVAVDISRHRLREMRELISKLGFRNIDIIYSDSRNIKIKRVNKILIDAPCSNSGAIGKDPALRLILKNERYLLRNLNDQRLILKNMLENVPFEYAVYSTCSVIPEEGEAQMERLNGVEFVRPNTIGVSGYKGYFGNQSFIRLFPHLHGTDGFFLSKLRREGNC